MVAKVSRGTLCFPVGGVIDLAAKGDDLPKPRVDEFREAVVITPLIIRYVLEDDRFKAVLESGKLARLFDDAHLAAGGIKFLVRQIERAARCRLDSDREGTSTRRTSISDGKVARPDATRCGAQP